MLENMIFDIYCQILTYKMFFHIDVNIKLKKKRSYICKYLFISLNNLRVLLPMAMLESNTLITLHKNHHNFLLVYYLI